MPLSKTAWGGQGLAIWDGGSNQPAYGLQAFRKAQALAYQPGRDGGDGIGIWKAQGAGGRMTTKQTRKGILRGAPKGTWNQYGTKTDNSPARGALDLR